MQFLIDHHLIVPVEDTAVLIKGNIIRRTGNSKDQQGIFICRDDKDGLVIVNVINMKEIAFETEAGILRPSKDDKLYVFTRSFASDKTSRSARKILEQWPLYVKHPALQVQMMSFMEHAFAPEQIIDFEKTGNLHYLFIPLQQKYKIGRCEEKVNWGLERKNRFIWHVSNMRVGDHITYVAAIPRNKIDAPLFYSLGTQPHESTALSLKAEPFNFKPEIGGHIKCTGKTDTGKGLLVDAGSSFLGSGKKTSIDKAQTVAAALKRIFKNHDIIPVAGRGAFEDGQSY
jgi:hypothetical protein